MLHNPRSNIYTFAVTRTTRAAPIATSQTTFRRLLEVFRRGCQRRLPAAYYTASLGSAATGSSSCNLLVRRGPVVSQGHPIAVQHSNIREHTSAGHAVRAATRCSCQQDAAEGTAALLPGRSLSTNVEETRCASRRLCGHAAGAQPMAAPHATACACRRRRCCIAAVRIHIPKPARRRQRLFCIYSASDVISG